MPAPDAPKRIMMLLWRGCEELCQGFKSWFERRHLPVEFEMRDAMQDRRRLADLVAEVEGRALGPRAHLGDHGVAGGARHAVGSGPTSRRSRGIRQCHGPDRLRPRRRSRGSGRSGIAGSMSVVPDDVQINAIRRYRPMRRLGVAYNTDEPNSVNSVKRLRALAGPMEFELVEVPIPADAAGRPDPAAIPEVIGRLAEAAVDFVYIGSSSFLLSNVVAFTEAAVAAGLPVAAAGEIPIRQGTGLLGVVSPNFVVGLLAGSQAEKILFDGARAEDLPVSSLKDYAYLINIDTAKRLHLPRPWRCCATP